MNTSIIKHLSYILFVSVLMMTCLFAGSTAFADPPGRHVVTHRHKAQHGRVVARLPVGHYRIHARGANYYYHRGAFYRKRPKGFVVVAAPVGAIISAPSVGFSTVIVHGSLYYLYGGVYYRKVSAGFMVVEAPRPVMVADNLPQQTTPVTILPEQVKVSAAALNVRTGPGLHHGVIQQVQRDDTLQVINSESGWLFVRLPSGQSGWVMDSFTTPIRPLASG